MTLTSSSVLYEVQQTLWTAINQFYIAEAWLLDDRRNREWLDLFTEDMLYYMPRTKNVNRRDLDREVPARGTDLPYFEDNRQLMEVRIQRLESGTAWSEEPPSRTRHLVGNLVIEKVADDGVVPCPDRLHLPPVARRNRQRPLLRLPPRHPALHRRLMEDLPAHDRAGTPT